jgi:pimeloyl-ACP methyl ester carboxylesterase
VQTNRRWLLLFTLSLITMLSVSARAEDKVLRIDPPQTDAAIESVHGPHLALYDPAVPSNHRLLLFFVGTGVHAEESLALDESFARLGYHVIALDYENTVVAASCVHSTDSACFDTYRAAIVSGTPGSDKIRVDPANSILNRFDKLLAYLTKEDAAGGWNEFFAAGKPAWNHIVLAGHSQGSGHAAYIAKLYAVDKVLMFSGPQDYLSDFDKPAPWESRPSATPPSRFYAFLNLSDPFNESHQVASCEALMHLTKAQPYMVEPAQSITGVHQILVTDADSKRAHNSTVSPQFENVWQYLGTIGEQSAAPTARVVSP